MSPTRRRFMTEYKVGAAHRVIDSDRSVSEVARELSINEASLYSWVRDERRRIEAARGTGIEPLTGAERAELLALRKQVHEQEKDLEFLGKAAAYFAKGQPNKSGLR
jgi:transposase